MASCSCRALVAFTAGATILNGSARSTPNFTSLLLQKRDKLNYSIESSSLDPPDVGRLAETARISLTPTEVEEFGPKIQQVVECLKPLPFCLSKLSVHLLPIFKSSPSDIPLFGWLIHFVVEWEAIIIAAIRSYEEPYIKVPKVLNKEYISQQ